MDFGWIATGVVGVAGAATTVFVQRGTTAAQARRDAAAVAREDARRAEAHARERRVLERDAVMHLVSTYQAAHRYARDFTSGVISMRMPIEGWPAHEEITEVGVCCTDR